MKLTAQFVARNGRQFLTNLMNREQRNYQFDFLRPQHSLFQYFTKLLEQYTKVLIPPKDLMKKLTEERNEKKVLEQVKYRVAWIKHQEEKRKKEEEATERERVSYAQIDWHNFVVVETVDYQPWEAGHFPPPTNPNEVGARVLMQRRVESTPAPPKSKISVISTGDDEDSDESEEEESSTVRAGRGGANTQVEDMDEESSSEDEEETLGSAPPTAIGKPLVAVDAAPAVQQPPPSLPSLGNVVVKSYDPKKAQAAKVKPDSEEYLVSPITGERIPASKVQEHMKIGLLDPRWVEERDKQITKKAQEDAVFAAGASIDSSLKGLAERRTDIFGVGEDAALEAGIGKKMGEEDKRPDERVTWDGHSSSAEAAARQARANISLDEQIQQIHRTKGLLGNEEKPGIGPPKPITTTGQDTVTSMQPRMVQPRPPVPVPQPINTAPPVPVAPPVGVPAMSVNLLPVRAPVPPPAPHMMMGAPPGGAQFFIPPAPGTQPQQMPPFASSMVPRPPGVPGMIQPPGLPGPPGVGIGRDESEEPAAKRARGEDSLINEQDFLNMYAGGLVSFQVTIPTVSDKPEWKLNGQLEPMTLPLSDQVSVVKAKLHELTGMPTGKQKLQMDAMFLKDSNSLAYYNISPGTIINLQIKERGGRKK